jgi:lipopolysaccharide/colanic/teichoic acid biosynthesis glycosyltransferase
MQSQPIDRSRATWLKRKIDLTVAIAGIILLSPVIGMISLVVWVSMGRPILFRQQRPGLHEQIFVLCKFRTMKYELGCNGVYLDDSLRITRFGRILRRTSLDELPELWNVVRGDMSLVGPRPLLVEYLPLYSAEQARRHSMKPGITGLAQVSGRNLLNWDERFKLDSWYVDNWSNALDLSIMVKTFLKVIRMEGISAAGCATMDRYRGSQLLDDNRARNP